MGRGGKWTQEEDTALARAWVVVSEDPIRGNQVKSSTFWGDIFQKFQAAIGETARTQGALQNRWTEINKSVQQFSGVLSKINALNESGTNQEDK
ncbi:unnamed protein product (mitochondrion) [Plasmodiophora brassicae]|uniref:Myb-like domain-containing protein n=1 Tax=Plasmodiophora brassicae TaxID=37360 RepID=A0A3P3YMW1_PLABS|nr:unnamed protein product [Plasmodiophora brassicae]